MNEQWIAGFFDGEGCVTSQLPPNGNRQYRISIGQSGDEGLDILTKIRDFLGMGSVCKLKRNIQRFAKKECYQFTLTGHKHLYQFWYRVGRYCNIKKFPEVITSMEQKILLRNHWFPNLNISGKLSS